MNRIPDLMRMMLTEMAREFPGQDLTVLAYAPSTRHGRSALPTSMVERAR